MTNYKDELRNQIRWVHREVDGKDKLILQVAFKNGQGNWTWQDVPVVAEKDEQPIT